MHTTEDIHAQRATQAVLSHVYTQAYFAPFEVHASPTLWFTLQLGPRGA